MKIPASFAETLPKNGERFVVRVFDAAPPYTVFVPTLETQLRRFGSEWGLPVPAALITGRALRHRQTVSVALVPRML
jgi:spermidine synthase